MAKDLAAEFFSALIYPGEKHFSQSVNVSKGSASTRTVVRILPVAEWDGRDGRPPEGALKKASLIYNRGVPFLFEKEASGRVKHFSKRLNPESKYLYES